jgi:hypothetical protein
VSDPMSIFFGRQSPSSDEALGSGEDPSRATTSYAALQGPEQLQLAQPSQPVFELETELADLLQETVALSGAYNVLSLADLTRLAENITYDPAKWRGTLPSQFLEEWCSRNQVIDAVPAFFLLVGDMIKSVA